MMTVSAPESRWRYGETGQPALSHGGSYGPVRLFEIPWIGAKTKKTVVFRELMGYIWVGQIISVC